MGKRKTDMSEPIYIIAEVGSNYNGNLDMAKRYIRAGKEAGANAVKFQSISKERFLAPRILSEGNWVDNPVYVNCPFQELSREWHKELKEEADRVGVDFFSTPFYLEAVDILASLDVSTIKIASGDITYYPLLEKVGRTGKRVILSTGASDLADIKRALDTLRQVGAKDIVLMHCVSNYPPAWSEMNLRALVTLKERYRLPVGMSDHTPGSLIPVAAVALGATFIEKHVTFDRTMPGPDHPFAMTMEEFAQMVKEIRLLEEALGTGEKIPTEAEKAKQNRIRRGVYDPVSKEPAAGSDGLWLRPRHR
jgi:N,N'-diacetyllegionaminate synthase